MGNVALSYKDLHPFETVATVRRPIRTGPRATLACSGRAHPDEYICPVPAPGPVQPKEGPTKVLLLWWCFPLGAAPDHSLQWKQPYAVRTGASGLEAIWGWSVGMLSIAVSQIGPFRTAVKAVLHGLSDCGLCGWIHAKVTY